MNKKIFYFCLLLLYLCIPKIINSSAFAKDKKDDKLIVKPESIPLFSEKEDGLWIPGYSMTKTVEITNKSDKIKFISISPENCKKNDSGLSKILEIKIFDNFGNTLYGGSPKKYLSNFCSLDEYFLSSLLPSHSIIYSFQVTLDGPSTGNKWQNKKTGFDLEINFTEPKQTPTPTPTKKIDDHRKKGNTLGEHTVNFWRWVTDHFRFYPFRH